MQLTADRKQLLTICKHLSRLVPETCPVEDLTGILFEADENGGCLRLSATNMETTLKYRIEAVVTEGGRMIANARLLAGMMPLLDDERVFFETYLGTTTVRVSCGSTHYDVSCLSGKHFPEPHVLPPENMVTLSGLASLVKQTAIAAKTKAASHGDMLVNAKLDIYPAEAHMTCTDGMIMAVARQKQENNGRISLLIPVKSLPLLTAVCGNDTVEAGMSGGTLVFKGKGFVYTTRMMQGVYPDTNAILSQIKPLYDAIADAGALRSDISCAGTVFEPGICVQIALREDGISLLYESSIGTFKTLTDAVVLNDMPGEGFHYNATELSGALRNLTGNLQVCIDRTGNMLLKSPNLCYLLTPRRPRKTEKAPEQKKKSKNKKAAKSPKPQKAA